MDRRLILTPSAKTRPLEASDQPERPELANKKGVVFKQDNARPHTSLMTRQKLREL